MAGVCSVWLCVCIRSNNTTCFCIWYFFFFQAEDGIRDLVRSRGLGDVYKRQGDGEPGLFVHFEVIPDHLPQPLKDMIARFPPGVLQFEVCLLYTSDAADERSSVDLGGRRIIKKKRWRIYMSRCRNTR